MVVKAIKYWFGKNFLYFGCGDRWNVIHAKMRQQFRTF